MLQLLYRKVEQPLDGLRPYIMNSLSLGARAVRLNWTVTTRSGGAMGTFILSTR